MSRNRMQYWGPNGPSRSYRIAALAVLAAVAMGAGARRAAHAEDMTVPSGPYPTLAVAVAWAKVNGDPVNTINVDGHITTSGTITLDANFDASRELIIRSAVFGVRATIESSHLAAAFVLGACHNVTLQDLDIIRPWPNGNNLIDIINATHCLIERCRMGAIQFIDKGEAGDTANQNLVASVLSISYPIEVVVRNSVCFSIPVAGFDRSIHVTNLTDQESSVFLYNNVVGDYGVHGIHIDDSGGVGGALALLRNNIAVNHVDIPPAQEPLAYRSDVHAPPTTIVTSHNVALAAAGLVEELGFGASTITGDGVAGIEFLRFDRSQVDDVFVTYPWFIGNWDPNVDFYRLEPANNPLHDDPDDYGETVADGSPHLRDLAVNDDIEHDPRPGGAPPHTDRGVDQLEPGQPGAVETAEVPQPPSLLWAAPRRNPARSTAAAIEYRTVRAGQLRLEVFDVSGRRVQVHERRVAEHERGTIHVADELQSGVWFYRLRLSSASDVFEVSGKLHVVQ